MTTGTVLELSASELGTLEYQDRIPELDAVYKKEGELYMRIPKIGTKAK